jgi:purine-binding chemotaxis protein CheW
MSAYVQFTIQNQVYAIPIESVVEVLHLVEITPVPDQPDDHLGVMTLRGRVIPVVDLVKRYTGTHEALTLNTPMIAVQQGDAVVALVVTSVLDVIELEVELEQSPEPSVRGIVRHENQVIIIPHLDAI